MKIMRRRDELAAYRRAGVHMFSLPGDARVAVLVKLVSVNLAEICTATSSRNAKLWYLTPDIIFIESPHQLRSAGLASCDRLRALQPVVAIRVPGDD